MVRWNLPIPPSLIASEPGWRPDMARGMLRGEGVQAGIGILTGLLTVVMIYFAATLLAG
jgi:hypothetical protein